MGDTLKNRLKQKKFASVFMEAHLSLMIAADTLQRQADEACDDFGISAQQYNVLRILRGVHPGGHARCDIIERMIQEAPDVTRLIDRLVKMGYAKRGKSKEDGRLSLTYITGKGLKLLDSMNEFTEDLDKDLQKRLTKTDARSLTTLCEKLYAE